MGVLSPVDLEKMYPSLLMYSVSWTVGCGVSSTAPDGALLFCVTSMRDSCVHTAVMSRNEMQHESRSMNGTRLMTASSGFLPPLPLGVGAAPAMILSSPPLLAPPYAGKGQVGCEDRLTLLHRIPVADHQVHDL